MNAARDRSVEFYDPARSDDIQGRTKTREEHVKDPVAALAKALECLENPNQGGTVCRCQLLSSQWLFSTADAKMLQKMWEGLYWEGVWLFLDPWECCGFAHNVLRVECSWVVWATWRVLIKKEPFADTEAVFSSLFMRRRFGHVLCLV